MHKKIIMTCMAIAAFAAFVVAPAASGATLTEPTAGGVIHHVAVGSSITGEASETKFTAGNSTVTCASAHMSGTVTANSNGTVAGEIAALNPLFTGTGSGGDCTSNGLGPVKPTVNSKLCLHVAKGTDTGSVTGCAGAPVTFTLDVTNLGLQCKYEKASIAVLITTEPADAEVLVEEGQIAKKEAGGSFFCPEQGELDMEFRLTTTTGQTLTFS
jgi:hypothetical protein